MSLYPHEPILTERLTLRLIEKSDLTALMPFYADADFLRYLPNSPWASVHDAERWFERIDVRQQIGIAQQFVIEENASGRLIGLCLLFNYDERSQRAEIGFALSPAHWGKGYMDEAMQTLLHYAFGACGLRRLEASVDPRNLASKKILARFGFRHEGTLREWMVIKGAIVDVDKYGLLQREWQELPD